MKKKIEQVRYYVNNELSKASIKIQKAEDGVIGCLVTLGIIMVSYAAGFRSGKKFKQ